MSTRPTPYGLFAGVGLIEWGSETDLALAAGSPRTRTRPDMGWLLELVDMSERDPAVRAEIQVTTHSAVLVHGGRAIATCSNPVVSVRATSAVRHVLSLARAPIPIAILKTRLSSITGAASEKIDGLIDELWRGGFFVSELQPPLTIGNPSEYVRNRLARIPAARQVAADFGELLAQCASVDERPLQSRAEDLTCLEIQARSVPGMALSKTNIQVDAALDLARHRVHRQVATAAAQGAELLLRLSTAPHGPAHLAAYRHKFEARYGHDRMIPLLELIDPDYGLGLPSPGTRDAQEPLTNREALLRRLAGEALRDGHRILHLDDDLLDRLSTWTPGTTPRAASKSCDHGWVVRRHAETGVFASGLVDIAGGWGGCDGCGGAADLRG